MQQRKPFNQGDQAYRFVAVALLFATLIVAQNQIMLPPVSGAIVNQSEELIVVTESILVTATILGAALAFAVLLTM